MEIKKNQALFTSNSDEYATPAWLFNQLNTEFKFTLDAAANKDNTKCALYYDKQQDGLKHSWKRKRVFCNPPYSQIKDWVFKCYTESYTAEVIVLLIPARTDTRHFHEYIYNKHNVEIRFIKGRLKFNNNKHGAPFPSMLAIFRKQKI